MYARALRRFAALLVAVVSAGLAAPAVAQQPPRIHGRVIAAETGQPIEQATVVNPIDGTLTLSAADGTFAL